MATEIEKCIQELYKEKTSKGDPGTKTDLAASLEFLSSGIYTEEERFIFELLQNAVDAFSVAGGALRIKIVVQPHLVIFMHNGDAFSTRDVEGICSVGNGAKSGDTNKIGYKGIGFKSVFMHSDHITIRTGDTTFGFDKEHWRDFFGAEKYSKTGREYKMPWQTIPILEEELPSSLDTSGYNVITYLRVADTKSLSVKIERLMGDCRFLLFLTHSKINIEYVIGSRSHNISKSSVVRPLSSTSTEQDVTLTNCRGEQSQWLVYKNASVAVPSDYTSRIHNDSKIPSKLQDVPSYDLSFAISLDSSGDIRPLEDVVLYTYLPTSCHISLPFLVNANFITDAGRQQLNVDTPWNQMVVSAISREYISWLATLSVKRRDYYKVLPTKELGIDGLDEYYSDNLQQALQEIPFVPSVSNGQLLLVADTLYDEISLREGLSAKHYASFLAKLFTDKYSDRNLIDVAAGKALSRYGSRGITKHSLATLLEDFGKYYGTLSVDECVKFCRWLAETSHRLEIPTEVISHSSFLLDEDNHLSAPSTLFFSSEYRDDNSIAQEATVLSPALEEKLERANLRGWLSEMGVHEMSNLSVIQNVICSGKFFDDISESKAIDVIRFVYDSDKKEQIVEQLSSREKENLRFVTEKGKIESASRLYLSKHSYGIGIEKPYKQLDMFVSEKYLRSGDDPLKWAMFLKALGINDKIEVVRNEYRKDTQMWRHFEKWIDYAHKTEYNVWIGGKYYLDPATLHLTTPPFLDVTGNDYDISQMVWNSILVSPLSLQRTRDDYIYGLAGWSWYRHAYLSDNTPPHQYLGEHFIPYALKTFQWLPGSDGKLHRVTEILDNSEQHRTLCGKYFPTLAVDCSIHDTWKSHMSFKESLSLDDYLTILAGIAADNNDRLSQENRDRISLVYSHIADKFDFSQGSSEYNTLRQWGQRNKILTSEKTYKYPKELVLVSDTLGRIDIADQVFRGKHIVARDARFVSMMKALGVTFVNTFTPHFGTTAEVNTTFKEQLIKLAGYLTLLSIEQEAARGIYDKEYNKVQAIISSWEFIQNDSITLSYAQQSIEKNVYVHNNEFHYVGAMSVSTKELLHDTIAEKLNIPKGNRTTMLTLLQISSIQELRDYMTEKGYNVSYVKEESFAKMGLGMDGTTLGEYEMAELNAEAKEIALNMLANDGYDTSKKTEVFSLVNGVTKDGEEYPLVVKSYRNDGYTFKLNPNEWEQLMRSKYSMLLVHRGEGKIEVGTLSRIFSEQERMSLSFKLEALENNVNITKIAEVLKYFKGCQFDFSNLLTARYVPSKDAALENKKNPNTFIDLSPDDENLLHRDAIRP